MLTPHVVRVGKIGRDAAYELGSGHGMEPGTTIYGVSVVRVLDEGTMERDYEASACFSCVQDATRARRETSGRVGKVVAYLRITESEGGHGLDVQRRAVEEFCRRRGFELLRVEEDDGASGRSTRNSAPALQWLEACRSEGAHAVVATRVDRLARSSLDFHRIVETATSSKARGGHVIGTLPSALRGSSTGATYACRHTFGAWSIAAGVQLFYLSRIMGTSVTQIDSTYGHLVPDSEDYLRGLLDTFDSDRAEADAFAT